MEAPPPAVLTPTQLASFQYQQEHITDDCRPLLIGACAGLWAVVALAVCLRFYAKRIVRSKYQHEDGMILIGLVWSLIVQGISIDAFGSLLPRELCWPTPSVSLVSVAGIDFFSQIVGTAWGAGQHLILSNETDLVNQLKVCHH